jgi:hypothetical protein
MAATSLVDYSSRGRGCLGTAIIVMMVTVYSILRAQTRQLQVVGEGKGVTFTFKQCKKAQGVLRPSIIYLSYIYNKEMTSNFTTIPTSEIWEGASKLLYQPVAVGTSPGSGITPNSKSYNPQSKNLLFEGKR